MWKKGRKKSQKPCWYRYGCSLQASEINPAARWGLCLGNHCTEVKSKCYLASLSTGCLRAGGCYGRLQLYARAIQESVGMGSALWNVADTWALWGAGPGGVGVQGLAGMQCRGPRGPAAANTSLHWHRTRDTRKPSDNRNTGRLRGGRVSNANPRAVSNLPGQDSRDCGILCRNVTLHVCVFVCVCVSLQYKQKSNNKKEAYKF